MIYHIQNGQNGRKWDNFEPLAEAVDTRNAQLALVVGHLPVVLAGNVIVALLTAGILSAIVSLSQVAVWSGLLIALTSVRTLLLRRYSTPSAELDGPDQTILRLAVASGFSGCLWGGLVLLLPESPLYHLFVAFVLGGMAAGAVVTLAPVWPVLLAFLLPCILPLTVRLALTGTSIYIGMAALATRRTGLIRPRRALWRPPATILVNRFRRCGCSLTFSIGAWPTRRIGNFYTTSTTPITRASGCWAPC
jgi:hypothetical protein